MSALPTLPLWIVAAAAAVAMTAVLGARTSSVSGALTGGVLLASVLAASEAPRLSLAVVLAVLLIMFAGADPRVFSPRGWLALEVAVALVTVAAGIRAHVSGVVLSDSLVTVMWLALVAEGFRRLHVEGAAVLAVTGLIAVGALLLAAFGSQPGVAALAAGLAASTASAHVLHRRRQLTTLSEAGAAALGIVGAVLTIAISPAVRPPESFAVAVALLAAPLAGPALRTLRGADWSAGQAPLITVTAVTVVLAVLAGRDGMPAKWLLPIAVPTVLLGVAGSTRGLRLKHVLGLGLAGLAALVPSAVALATAQAPARQAATLARSALDQASTMGPDSTATTLGQARQLFRKAASRLELPGASVGLAVPALATNLSAARTLVSLGGELSAAGITLADASEQLRLREGGVELDELRELNPILTRAASTAGRSKHRLRSLNPELLAGPLRSAVELLEDRLDGDLGTLRLTADAARRLPAILGRDGPRHYFLAFQSNGELRGTGGFIGAWGEIEANDGRLRLTRYGQLAELNEAGVRPRKVTLPEGFREQWGGVDVQQFWEGVNVSPDFPTTAGLITQLYPQSGGRPLDGVLAIDAPGLASLLEIAGPISVPGWPEPITSTNVVDITLRAATEYFPNDAERHKFLAEVVRRTVDTFTTSADGADARTVVRALATAADGKHLLVYLTRPQEQALARASHVDGAVPPVRGDSVLVVNQNFGGNKTDLFLHRDIVYRATLRPERGHVDVAGNLEVALRNDAPSSALAVGLIGPHDPARFAPGENRTNAAVYTALEPTAVEHEEGMEPKRARDLGRWVESSTISIPSGQTRTVTLSLAGRTAAGNDGWYRLDLLHQTAMNPDHVEVTLDVPPPWRIEDARGATTWDAHEASFRAEMDRAATLALRLGRGEKSPWERLWNPAPGASPKPDGSSSPALTYGAVAAGGLALWRRRQGAGMQVPGAG